MTIYKTDKNCEKCLASYSPYKVGLGEDCGTHWCCLSVRDENGEVIPPSGVCQFCNPKSKLYNK